MKRICVDMDEVMADALGEHLLRYNRHYGEKITLEDLQGKWLWDVVSTDRHDVLDAYLRSDDFFEVHGGDAGVTARAAPLADEL